MDPLEKICSDIGYDAPDKVALAIESFGFVPGDTLCGAESLERWYDMECPGVRWLLRLYLEEFTALFETNNAYRVYASVPCPSVLIHAFNETGRVRVFTAELCTMVVMQGILGLPPIAQSGAGCGKCALLENRKGFFEGGKLPHPDALWSFGLLCDECCKGDEAIGDSLDVRQLVSFCQKSWAEKRYERYESGLRTNIKTVCREANIPLPDGKGSKSITAALTFLAGNIGCINLAVGSAPLKSGTLSLIHTAQLMSFRNMEKVASALGFIRKNMYGRTLESHIKKIYCYYIPPCLPELGAVFADKGLCLAGNAAFIARPVRGSFSSDLAGMSASTWDSSILSRSTLEYAEQTAAVISKYNCAGYLNGMFSFDRWLGAGHKLTDAVIEKLSDRPVFHCDTDFWGRDFNRSKMENLAETVSFVCEDVE